MSLSGSFSSKVADYNSIYSMDAELLPAEFYSIPEPTGVIPVGGTTSNQVEVKFENLENLDVSKLYVLPVGIVSAPFGVLSNNTFYFLIKEASIINVVANMSKNYATFLDGNQAVGLENLSQVTVEALVNPDNFPNTLATVNGYRGAGSGSYR